MLSKLNKKMLELLVETEISMEDEDMLLALMQINTEEKLKEFETWIRTKMKGDSFQVTAAEIMHKTSELGRLTAEDLED